MNSKNNTTWAVTIPLAPSEQEVLLKVTTKFIIMATDIVAIKHKSVLVLVPKADILYGLSDGSYTHIHLGDGRKITLAKKLKEVLMALTSDEFFRIHHSHFINLFQIEKMLKVTLCKVVMKDGRKLNVSRSKFKDFMSCFAHL